MRLSDADIDRLHNQGEALFRKLMDEKPIRMGAGAYVSFIVACVGRAMDEAKITDENDTAQIGYRLVEIFAMLPLLDHIQEAVTTPTLDNLLDWRMEFRKLKRLVVDRLSLTLDLLEESKIDEIKHPREEQPNATAH